MKTQTDIYSAIARQREGLDRVESSSGDFVPLMRQVAAKIARERGEVCSDDLRRYASEHDITPGHPNAWGTIFRKGFRCIGRRRSCLVSNHAREIRVWALAEGE